MYEFFKNEIYIYNVVEGWVINKLLVVINFYLFDYKVF